MQLSDCEANDLRKIFNIFWELPRLNLREFDIPTVLSVHG